LVQAAHEALGPGGRVVAGEPGFRLRDAQQQMARAVAAAIDARETLVVEAGTGVGKTFAYLVPVLLSGRRAIVSTATKSLQDQLFLRDLPRLISALQLPTRVALLKGRSSYLCPYRLGQARSRADASDLRVLRQLAQVESWARSTVSGDLAELPGLEEGAAVVPLVTSTRENCLGAECPDLARCPVMRARREALAADVVVVNHHLYFADVMLRDTGVAELLPSVDVAVFDEAHQLVDAGLGFLGCRLGTGQLVDLARDLAVAGLRAARGLRPWAELAAALERAGRDLALAAGAPAGARLAWREVAARPLWRAAIERVHAAARDIGVALEAVQSMDPEFRRLQERLNTGQAACSGFLADVQPGRVRWVEVGTHAVRLVESPLDISAALAEQRDAASRAWIFTSATLGDDEALSWFVSRAGLADARVLRVGSPFDYGLQARIWVPAPFPRPTAAEHPGQVAALATRCARALGGRTFVLTTTLRVLPMMAGLAREALRAADPPIEVLVQGEAPRRAMLQRFGDGRGRMLFGSQSFWEGIDVPGDALQCVLIDKLPFPPPNDPLVEARGEQARARGGDPFQDVFVAEAAIALKQGAGRLIRTEDDTGLLIVCDPRLASMPYGRRLLAALPAMQRVFEDPQAEGWLQWLASRHEPR
jgi:ATP-dependent DNA helicase DinG